jgi:hypothetical protein
MKSLALATALLFAVTACGVALADDAATTGKTCATNAVSNGKPLTGAARTSSVKKCCETGAVGSDGKPLAGAAKNSFMKACQAPG